MPKTQSKEGITYAHKLDKQEAQINWHQKAHEVERNIRGINPFPIAKTQLNQQTIRLFKAQVLESPSTKPAGTIVKVSRDGIDVACQDHLLRVLELQMPSRKRLAIFEILNGNTTAFKPGQIFQ